MNNNNGEEKRRKEGKWTTIEWKSFHPPFLDRQLDLHIEVIRIIDESPITYRGIVRGKRKKRKRKKKKRKCGWCASREKRESMGEKGIRRFRWN